MCDCLVALPRASASGVTLLAKNSDRPPDEAQHLEWLPPRRDERSLKVTYMEVAPAPGHTIGVVGSRPWWMWGLEHGVNEAGVAIGNEAIFTTLDPHGLPARLIGMDLVRLGLERGESAYAAIEVMIGLLERYGQGGSGHYGVDDPYWSSFLVADHGEAWVLETSGREWALERVQRVRAISNRTTIPAFDAAHRDLAMPTEVVTDPRLRASQAVLAADPVTVCALRAHLRDHTSGDGGFSVCMHVPDYMATTAALIAELPGPFPSGRPLAHVCLGQPCTSIFVPLAVGRTLGHPPDWARFTALGTASGLAEARGALAALEAELAEAASTCADSEDWAEEAWGRVEACLPASGP